MAFSLTRRWAAGGSWLQTFRHIAYPCTVLFFLGVILHSEIVYRTFPVTGFDQPFVQGQNFGAWMDTVLMGKINPSGWVAINALPTAAHTIWGVLAGEAPDERTSRVREADSDTGWTWRVMTYLCHWLYERRIFIKI